MPLDMTGCVIAGGRSTRMGSDKASLVLGGRTLAARQVERLRAIFRHVIAATNNPNPFQPLGIECVADRRGEGPLAGIAAALAAAPTAHVFVCAVDMPFLSEPLVRFLCSLAPSYDIVVPRGEPAHAVYGRPCLATFDERLAAGKYKIDAAFEGLRVRFVEPEEVRRFDPEGRSFRNVNTPEELRRTVEEVGREGGAL